jgi:predicted nucleotidyltransferase
MVYYPSSAAANTRRQLTTGRACTKFVCHGYASEIPRMAAGLPKWVFDRLTEMMTVDASSGEQHLNLPNNEIVDTYNAKSSLQQLRRGLVPGFSRSATETLQEGLNAFHRAGIGEASLGLYGGLQCFLVQETGTLNDLDVLVEGLDAYEAIIALSNSNIVRPETFPAFVAQDPVKRAVAIRRGQLSQFRLASNPAIVVDIRIVRASSDQTSFPHLNQTMVASGVELELTGARVIDASESLSLPAAYVVDTPGGIVTISTRYYHSLGAATTGNRVNARGLLVNRGQLLLLDANSHFIVSAT